MLLERRGLDRNVAGHPLPLEGPHDPFGPNDLPELAPERRDLALGALVDDPPGSTGPEVHLATADLVAPRPPPVRHVLARAVGLEHQLARSVEDPRRGDLAVRRGRHLELVTAWGHCPPPFLVPGALPGTRPAGRSSPPRSGGTAASTPRPPSAAPPRAGPAATAVPGPG